MEHVKAYGGNTCNDEQHQCTGQVTVSTTISRQIPDRSEERRGGKECRN